MRKKQEEPKRSKQEIIATRKSCDASGTGLSHYILVDKKDRK